MTTRRTILTAIPAVALAGCGSTTPATVNTDLTIAQSIDAGLIKIVGEANTLFPAQVSTASANTATGYLSLAGKGITALLGMTLPPAGASTWTQIDTYFQDAMDLVTPILGVVVPGAAPIIAAIDAVETLLPVFEAAITPTPVAAAARRRTRLARHPRARVVMSTADALATLQGYLAAPPVVR